MADVIPPERFQLDSVRAQNGINRQVIDTLAGLLAEVQALTIKTEALESWAVAHGADQSELDELAERIRQDREWAQQADGQPEPGAES